MQLDKDLASIQEVRNLVGEAKKAQEILATFSQQQIDDICAAIAEATYKERISLAKLAQEETGFGIWEDKVIKNSFASKNVYEYIKDMKTVGILKEDVAEKIMEVAVPVGVVAGLVPSTNPTSTVIYKALIAIKAGNSIVFSPHPNALKAIIRTVEIIQEAAISAGAPVGAVSVMMFPTIQGTNALMKHPDTALILATGGSAMVRAAYSSGTPAIGVGPGNGPAYIERSANIKQAVQHIMDSKVFDNGTICASEQSIIVEETNRVAVMKELERQGGYFLSKSGAEQLAALIMRPNGSMNPKIVGKSVQTIAKLANLSIPQQTRLIIAEESEVGDRYPYSKEKLAPIIAFYTVKNWEEACDLSIRILQHEGAGHTMIIHTENQDIVKEFALKKPVSRLLVNTPGALGGIGATTNLIPALTLGCGAVGGSSTSDNIGPENLFNLRRIAYGVRELADIRKEESLENQGLSNDSSSTNIETTNESMVEKLVIEVLSRLKNRD